MTIVGNSASSAQGGGIYDLASKFESKNSIIAGNSAASSADCYAANGGVFTSLGYNLTASPDTCSFSKTGDKVVSAASIGVGPLAHNGGSTETRALSTSSPATNAGNPAGCTDPFGVLLKTDQRGLKRPSGGRCDIGAYELQFAAPKCTLKAKSTHVLVKKPKKHAAKAGKVGVLPVAVQCNQAARVKLSGRLVVKRKKHPTRTYKLAPPAHNVTAGKALIINLKLPKAAVSALAKHASESLSLTLSATNVNGAGSAKLTRVLKPRTH